MFQDVTARLAADVEEGKVGEGEFKEDQCIISYSCQNKLLQAWCLKAEVLDTTDLKSRCHQDHTPWWRLEGRVHLY